MLLNKIKIRTIRVHVANLSALRYILPGAFILGDSSSMCHMNVKVSSKEKNANAYKF